LTTAIIPGSFDPITYGHEDIIRRGIALFDDVIVAVAKNPEKTPIFDEAERCEMIKEVFKDEKRVKVDVFDGLLVNYCQKNNVKFVLRGLRVLSDFEYEFRMALMNRKLADEIETVYVMPREQFSYFTSKLVREIASYDGPLSYFVPKSVEHKLRKKYGFI
jgi:pantetheine-phosphate adenylyltransferase